MQSSTKSFERLVSGIAIRSKRDLVIKPFLFYLAFVILGIAIETALMPVGARKPVIELMVIIAATSVVLAPPFFAIITYQHRLQEKFVALALTDSLTGLPNRRAFLSRLNDVQDREDAGFLMVLDADHFKRINDTYGHAAGDECLIAIADRLRSVCSPKDFVGRLGGEEFGLFLAGMSDSRRKLVSETLVRPIRVALENRDSPVKINFTLSVGQTELAPSLPFETLMHRADVALFSAKTGGRARAHVWTPDLEVAS